MFGEPGSSIPTAEALLCAIAYGVGEPLAVSMEALNRAAPSGHQVSVYWDEARQVWWVLPAPHEQKRSAVWDVEPPALGAEKSDGDVGSEPSPGTPKESSTSAPGSSLLRYSSETPGCFPSPPGRGSSYESRYEPSDGS